MGRLPATAIWELVDVVQGPPGWVRLAGRRKRGAGGARRARCHDRYAGPRHGAERDGDKEDPLVIAANARGVYGEPITNWLDVPSLAEFVQKGVAVESPVDPGVNVHRYYFGLQAAQKTALLVPVGEPEGLDVPHSVEAHDWTLGFGASDKDFLRPLGRLRVALVALAAGAVLLVLIGAMVFSKAVTRADPAAGGAGGPRGAGRLEERAVVSQEDELGSWGGASTPCSTGWSTSWTRSAGRSIRCQRPQARCGSTPRWYRCPRSSSPASAQELEVSAQEVAATVQLIAQDANEQMGQVQRTADPIQGLDWEIGR